MKKILISWYAYNNDFVMEHRGSLSRRIGTINEAGPSFNVHKYFWDSSYSKHILLNGNGGKAESEMFNLLINELRKEFPKRVIEGVNLTIDDPINVQEIYSKVSAYYTKELDGEVDVFISPGTPAMQVAWYMLGLNQRPQVCLFQIRAKEFTKDKIKPEKEIVQLDESWVPQQLNIIQKSFDQSRSNSLYVITSSLEKVYNLAERVAVTNDIGCLILGENGTGKEHLAKYIHENSHRKSKPMLSINCAAFSDELLRSELFGHEKGSFTGADSKKIGILEAANGGTVFLDEVGDISSRMQVSLLRVIQERKIQPIGSNIEKQIDVRIISATNRDLEKACDDGTFRWDLFYRLAVTTLKLPALRERGQMELKQMIKFFNQAIAYRLGKKQLLNFSPEAFACLLNYGFKGNVRELENLFIQLHVFGEQEIDVSHLPKRIVNNNGVNLTLEKASEDHIKRVFRINNGNILITSKVLGMARATLQKKLREYGIREI